jgi:insulysin
MIRTTLFLFSFIPYLLASSYSIVEDRSHLTLSHPTFSERKEEKIVLNNGLKILLISDPKADQSAASMAVGVGSWNDPKNSPGTAHFVEHMLFYGCDKYPEKQGIFKAVIDNKGLLNAFTAPDKTVYTFSSNHDAFFSILDRFSHFFIDPIITDEDMHHELEAVDQEFQKNWDHDGWRAYFISKEMGNQAHPNARFSTGNHHSLGKLTSDDLMAWYQKHYSADRMYLVIYSSQSLDTLKEEVLPMFAKVPVSDYDVAPINIPTLSNKQKGQMTWIEPVKEIKNLSLGWELPISIANSPGKMPELIAYAINQAHENSLLAILEKKNLATSVQAIVSRHGKNHALLEIDVDLTNEGIWQKEQVIATCFSFINALKKNSISESLFEEMIHLKTWKYHYQERQDSFSYAEGLARLMPNESFETFPRASIMPTKYDPKVIHETLSFLSPENCMYTLIAPSTITGVSYTNKEKWYQTSYVYLPVSKELFSAYKQAEDLSMAVIPPNPYAPEEITLFPYEGFDKPYLFSDSEFGKAFFFQEKKDRAPFISHHIHIKSPAFTGDERSNSLIGIYCILLDKTLRVPIENAKQANLNFTISYAHNTLTFDLYGFSDKAGEFLDTVVKNLRFAPPSKEQFESVRQYLEDIFKSGMKNMPFQQGLELADHLLLQDKFTSEELYEAAQKISFEEYATFHNHLLDRCYVQAMFGGNINQSTAEKIWLDIHHFLRAKPYPTSIHPKKITPSLPNEPTYLSRDLSCKGNLALLLVDLGSFSHQDKSCQSVLSQAIKEAFFAELRTKQKTGYIAKAFPLEKEKELFLAFLVQSATYEPMDLLYRFELFIENFMRNLSQVVPQKRFDRIKENLITSLRTHTKSLQDRSTLFDSAAFEKEEQFDWIALRIEAYKNLSYQDFCHFCLSKLSKDNPKRLAILLSGTREKQSFSYRPLTDQEMVQIRARQDAL